MESRTLKDPLQNMQNNYLKIDGYIKQMTNFILVKQKEQEKLFENQVSKLDALSPLKTLSRGYSITQKNGKMIKSANELNAGDKIELKFADGEKQAEII